MVVSGAGFSFELFGLRAKFIEDAFAVVESLPGIITPPLVYDWLWRFTDPRDTDENRV